MNDFFSFIKKSPTYFHAIKQTEERLMEAGYVRLYEEDSWSLENKKYYVIRNDAALIAFNLEKNDFGFNIMTSHVDSPSFRLKAHYKVEGKVPRLDVETYGGILSSSFFDRPLGLAGRLVDEEKLSTVLVDYPNTAILPNMPVHLLKNGEYNAQIELPFLINDFPIKNSPELFLYNQEEPRVMGDYFMSPRIDDLEAVYASLKGFLQAKPRKINVLACLSHEEIGSQSLTGALGTFLSDTLERINNSLGFSREEFHRSISQSLLISADNIHAYNPNHDEKFDVINRVYMNNGLVIKYNAANRYATDATGSALVKKLFSIANLPYQEFTNRSDVRGGSTMGPLINNHLGILTVDIGAPQWAMHSAYETAGIKDLKDFIYFSEVFYSSKIVKIKDKYEVK